jgi:hypothetical protein
MGRSASSRSKQRSCRSTETAYVGRSCAFLGCFGRWRAILPRMDVRSLAANGHTWTAGRARLNVWAIRPLLVIQVIGFGDGAFGPPIVAAFESLLPSAQSLNVFFDFFAMHNYDSTLRTLLTQRFRADLPRIASLDVCTDSKLVAMGVAVANLSLGGIIRLYRERAPLFSALDSAAAHAGLREFRSDVLFGSAGAGVSQG